MLNTVILAASYQYQGECNGDLPFTGFDIVMIATLGLALIAVAALLRAGGAGPTPEDDTPPRWEGSD